LIGSYRQAIARHRRMTSRRGRSMRGHRRTGRKGAARAGKVPEASWLAGIEECFKAFLPKPNVIIDDQAPTEWRRLVHVHPSEATSKTVQEYANAVFGSARPP
jgi:hypothetical protein